MSLYLNAEGGLAGDMICAGLLSLGADLTQVISAMEMAGSALGIVKVEQIILQDGAHCLRIDLWDNEPHLAAAKAQAILSDCFNKLEISEPCRLVGKRALEILIEAEGEVHRHMPEMDHHIHHTHHLHHHDGHSAVQPGSFLHEAQDIVMDICGAMTALSTLNLVPQITLLAPVAVGGGTVRFSHGTLPVPAPATRLILERFNIPWKFGPVEQELCTPTGAALLAALYDGIYPGKAVDLRGAVIGKSRGTRPVDVPALTFYWQP